MIVVTIPPDTAPGSVISLLTLGKESYYEVRVPEGATTGSQLHVTVSFAPAL